MAGATVTEPFPISKISNRYLLFDVDVVSYARREHNVCGVLIGTIPHLSMQNVFLGVPLELMPEEARRLVELGHAYIVDDAQTHKAGFLDMSREDRLEFLKMMDKQGMETALNAKKKAEEKSERALKQKGLDKIAQQRNLRHESVASEAPSVEPDVDGSAGVSLFDSTPSTPAPKSKKESKVEPFFITPTTSYPPLPTPPMSPNITLPYVPRTYPLFRSLHSKGYFLTPGLRFGCNYTVYPGDPLRYHSHFLATGLDWDEEFELLDIVGGGRLGTGVKKAYLIGGEPAEKKRVGQDDDSVRAFSIEWAGL